MVDYRSTHFFRAEFLESIETKKLMLDSSDYIKQIKDLSEDCRLCLNNGGKLIFAGNGGSFADSQHIAGEFISKLKTERRPLPAIALGTNSSILSSIGNDYGFEHIFSRELFAHGSKKDLFIPITTSGNSANILKAVDTALKMDIKTIGLTGNEGGKLAKMVDTIIVPSKNVLRIQECHILIGHIICAFSERDFIE